MAPDETAAALVMIHPQAMHQNVAIVFMMPQFAEKSFPTQCQELRHDRKSRHNDYSLT